jgi:hypothetical protein
VLISAEGEASTDEVWRRYTHPASWPGWAPQIRRVDAGDPADEVIERGTRGTVHGPLLTRVPFRIRSVDHQSRRWSWWVGFGPVGVGMDHGVDETGTGSRAWVRIHAHRYLVRPYVPMAKLALRRLVRA